LRIIRKQKEKVASKATFSGITKQLLIVFKENGIDLDDAVFLMADAVFNDQIKGTGRGQCQRGSGKKILRLINVQLQRDRQSKCGFLFRVVVFIGADL